MGKKEKKKKGFWTYFGILILILLSVIIICLGLMFFAPGSNILGFQYFTFSDKKTQKIHNGEIPGLNKKALVINARGVQNINILPNQDTEDIDVEYIRSCSGFIKTKDANFEFGQKNYNETFDSSESFDVLELVILEPESWSVATDSIVNIYMPNNFASDIIYVDYTTSDININMTIKKDVEGVETTYSYFANNLHINADGFANIVLSNPTTIKDCYFRTDRGSLSIINEGAFTADNLTFTSNNGAFKYTNNNGNAEINLTDTCTISSRHKKGPSVNIDKLNANLKCDLNSGIIQIKEIGSTSSPKTLNSLSSGVSYNIGTVNGNVSFVGNGGGIANSITIDNIVNATTQKSNFTVGDGYLDIKNITGDASFNSASGSINVANIAVNSNIYAISDSGSINISYVESAVHQNNTVLDVFTNTGNIILNNVCSMLHVNVFNSSPSSQLDITFSAVSYNHPSRDYNLINAGDRDVNINLKGYGDDLIFRMACQNNVVTKDIILVEEIQNDDLDSFLNELGVEGYTNSYRIGYNDLSSMPYSGKGLLLLKSTNSIAFKSI